ncbi:MAG: Hsp20/alpha crystallin family protein [Calditrichaeota bacterium]|nr:Hsp20/alpha crystallin family protein [Calditrichota bacterium]
MTFQRFGPKRRMINFKGDFDRLFEEFFGGSDDELDKGDVSPKVSIEDKAGEYIVRYELAGLSKEDVKVTYKNEKLYITGDKKEEAEQAVYYKNERKFGKIARGIEIPMLIKADEIDAVFENGLLSVTLPKEEEDKEPGIEVNIK